MNEEFLGGRIVVNVGDITTEDTDAIVNAANATLEGGGGVDGAIHRKGGSQILEECRRIRSTDYPHGLPTGEAVVTTGGLLPARFVIHTVGPIYGQNNGRDAELLANCYFSSLSLAGKMQMNSVAFPSISTGVYAYPKDEAAVVASRTLTSAVAQPASPELIRLVFHSNADAQMFLRHCQF